MPTQSHRHGTRAPRSCGFTFLEVLLALAVMVVIASIFVFSYTSLMGGRSLSEGAMRFESVLRLARAEATHTGKRLRLLVNGEDGSYRVEWEPNPLTEPGAFVDFAGAGWAEAMPLDLVRVVRLDLHDDDWVPSEESGGTDAASSTRVNGVTFLPDGSSESASFVLASSRADDPGELIVEIDGVNGIISTHEPESGGEP